MELLALLIIAALPIITHSTVNQQITGGVNISASMQVKGILALLIVAHHMSFHFKGMIFPGQFGPWGTVVVSIFFFLSGYGLIKSKIKSGDDYIDHFISKRFSKLLPTFILATAVFMVIELLGDKSLGWFAHRFANGFPPLPTSWFIYAIIFLYLAFYASCKTTKSLRAMNITMLIFTAIYCAIVLKVLHWGGWWANAVPALNLGIFIASYEQQILNTLLKKRMRFTLFTVLVAIVSLGAMFVQLTPIYNLTICILLWLILATKPGFNSKTLSFLGKYSYEIYLVQGAVIALCARSSIIEKTGAYLSTIIICFISILTAFILKYVADRLTPSIK